MNETDEQPAADELAQGVHIAVAILLALTAAICALIALAMAL